MPCAASVFLALYSAMAAGWGGGSAAGGQAEEVRRLFDRTADDEGRTYVVGRSYLEQQGQAILPLLNEKTKADDHRQRDLAKALLLRIESPERTAALYRGIDAWETHLLLDKPEVARVELAQAVEYYVTRKTEPPVPPEGVTYDRMATPLLIDYLRATAHHRGGGGPERGRPRAVAMLAHLGDPSAAPALVDALAFSRAPETKAVEEALVQLGPAALPALRRALADAPTSQVTKPDAARQRAWRRMLQSAAIARTLARFGDRQSVPLLVAKLKASEYPQQQTELVQALGALQDPRGVPAAFDLLLHMLRNDWFRTKQSVAKYGEVRSAVLQFGPVAKEHLAKQLAASQPLDARVVAAGLLFEIEHPEAAARFYEAIGRNASDRVLRRFFPPEKLPDRPPKVRSSMYGMLEEIESDEYGMLDEIESDEIEAKPAAEIQPAEYVPVGWGSYWLGYGLSCDAVPDEVFAPAAAVLTEHALWSGRSRDLERLARLKKPAAAFDVLLEIVSVARNPDDASRAVRALALWGGQRAIEELQKLADQPNKVRPDDLVEAALLVGDPAAAGILDVVQATADHATQNNHHWGKAWREAAALRADVAPAVMGDRTALRQLLNHQRPAIRVTAARLLLRQGDTSGIGILLDELPLSQVDQALRTRHELVSRGKPVLDALRQFKNEPPGSPRRVLAAAVALRITDPELAAKFDRAIVYRSFGFGTMPGPSTESYRLTGRHIAARVGPQAVPLLEAEVVAAGNWSNGEVAAFALAVFKQKPSMDLLVSVLRDLERTDVSRELTAHAIRDFGEEGLAAIKDIPVPDPHKPAFESRAGRFRGATDALAGVDPDTAAENVIRGLTALAADSVPKDAAWANSVQRFLGLARHIEDPAIIEPVLSVLKHRPDALEGACFHLLSRFEDPRLIEPALEALLAPQAHSPRHWSYWRRDQLLTLARQLKEQTAARLVKELKESKDAARRARAIEALPQLIEGQSVWRAIYPPKANGYDPREAAARKASLEAALEPLLATFSDPDPAVQEAAAKALTAIRQSLQLASDDRPVRLLLAWLPKAKVIPNETAEFLVRTRHEAVKPVLLAAFRNRGRKDHALLAAFRQARWAEAVPEVYASLREVVASGNSEKEAGIRLQVLENLQPDGRARLHDVLRDRHMPLGVRVDAARELSGQRYPPLGRAYPAAYDDVIALRNRIQVAADDDPQLKTIIIGPFQAARDDLAARRRYAIQSLTIAAAKLDPQRGYPMLIQLLATLDDAEFRQPVAYLLEHMQAAEAKR